MRVLKDCEVTENPVDSHYKALSCELRLMDTANPMFKAVLLAQLWWQGLELCTVVDWLCVVHMHYEVHCVYILHQTLQAAPVLVSRMLLHRCQVDVQEVACVTPNDFAVMWQCPGKLFTILRLSRSNIIYCCPNGSDVPCWEGNYKLDRK